MGGPNDTEVKRTIDSLYIGRNNNGIGDWVFKLDTKEQVSMNRITITPMSIDFIQRVNDIGTSDDQPAGIQMPDAEGKLTILDFLTNIMNDDSHSFDESYKYPDNTLDNDVSLNVENINEGIPKSKLQWDHFQGCDDVDHDDGSNEDDANDYASIASSASIHSTGTTNTNVIPDNLKDTDVIVNHSDNDDESSLDNEPEPIEPEKVPRGLNCTLDDGYCVWIGLVVDDKTSDLAVNLDKCYWWDNNTIMWEEA